MASNNDDDVCNHRLRFGDVAKEPLRMLPPIEGYQEKPLVSLEEAIEPLKLHVPDIANYASEAKKKCQKSSGHGLSVDESASIWLYTMEWKGKDKGQSLYSLLNEKLRSENRDVLKVWFLYLKLVITGLVKIPSTPRRLLRGVNLNLSEKYPKGDSLIWWAFSSCTDSMKVVESFSGNTGERTIFEIDCYSGKDVSQYSAYPTESEVLLIAATQFQVVSNINKGNGSTVIHLNETEPKYPLIEKNLVPNASPSLPTQQKLNKPVKPPIYVPKTEQPKSISLPPAPDKNLRSPAIRYQIDRVQPRLQATIDGGRLTEQDMKDIVELVIIEKRCPKIHIRGADMTPQIISELGRGIRESATLVEVDLSSNHLSSKDVSLLAGELSVNQTRNVEQWRCCGLVRMKELESGQIKILNLSNNNIDDEGINYLVVLLKSKRTLTDIYLNDNQIGDRGIELLAKALSHPAATLQKLYLSNNKRITDRSANYLVEMFKKNQSLTTLWLLSCDFNDSNRQKLTEAASSKKGFHLNIERFYQK